MSNVHVVMPGKVRAMTLVEAIAHADEQVVALGNCECANEHKQLSTWLKELKGRRSTGKDEGTWQCPYCYKEVSDEHSECCGKVGHAEFILREISND